jgi:hypothetical protein
MSVSCSIWHHGLAGSFEMSEAEYEELKRICDGTQVHVKEAFVTKKKWRIHKLPFSHVLSMVMDKITSPTPHERNKRRVLYNDKEVFTPAAVDSYLAEPMERHEDIG